jgi:hypothetical protein
MKYCIRCLNENPDCEVCGDSKKLQKLATFVVKYADYLGDYMVSKEEMDPEDAEAIELAKGIVKESDNERK